MDTNITLTENNFKNFHPILKSFLQSYIKNFNEINSDKNKLAKWLFDELKQHLPNKNNDEIIAYRNEIISSLNTTEEKKSDLQTAISNGRSRHSWFAYDLQKTTEQQNYSAEEKQQLYTNLSQNFSNANENFESIFQQQTQLSQAAISQEFTTDYLNNLDNIVEQNNSAFQNTITTKSGSINANPNLDGFIAEQHHVNTFNANAAANNSKFRAEVLLPKDGQTYGKNSVDIVIKDTTNGKIVSRYQSKYCKDATATENSFKKGNYRGQQKLVPTDQKGNISSKTTDTIQAPDGTQSNPLSKTAAKQMQKDAQSGNWDNMDWNNTYQTKDLAIGISKQAGMAAVQGAAIGAGFEIAGKLIKGEKIDGGEIIENAIKNGADFGVKSAVGGALKVAAETNILPVLKGTPAGTLANTAFVAVENAKILWQMGTGQLSLEEGAAKLAETTVSATAGLVAMGKGAALGASLGSFAGPIGAAVGGFIGGTVGYIAGSTVGQAVIKGAKTIASKAVSFVKDVASAAADVVKSGFNAVCSFFGF